MSSWIANTWLRLHVDKPNSHLPEMRRLKELDATLYNDAKEAFEKLLKDLRAAVGP